MLTSKINPISLAKRAKTMQDEQPTFKVTDRRLFNADGTPRDLPPEESAETAAAVPASAPEPAKAATSSAEHQVEAPPQPSEELDDDEELEGAQDPASFVNFLMSIASNAASALGMMENPVTHQREVDLQLGKQWIDVLGMLQKKTQGNLTKQEQQLVEGLLSDLRMQYVSLANAPQKARTFSGKDITGGK
jgi:hypothetical protein